MGGRSASPEMGDRIWDMGGFVNVKVNVKVKRGL